MDSFQLGRSLGGLVVMAIAALSLSVLASNLLIGLRRRRQQRLLMVNHLGLSYLHWGWAIPGLPLAATYAGMVGTTAITLYRFAREGAAETQKRANLPFSLNGALILYALLILLIRAIFFAAVPVPQLGLAIALGGALIVGQTAQEFQRGGTSRFGKSLSLENWEAIGGGLIVLGWLVSVHTIAWQALIISILGLWFFTLRLYRQEQSGDFIWLWLTGLQMFWLVWRLIPDSLQNTAIAWGQQLTGLENQSLPLLSLAFFPYLVLTVNFAEYFIRRNKENLAVIATTISGSLGIILTVFSLVNPLLRTLNFVGSSLLLMNLTRTTALKEWQRETEELSPPQVLALSSHVGLVLTLVSGIDWLFPQLSIGYWALICLGLMLLETLWYLKPLLSPIWLALMGSSAKGFALSLGAIAYCLLWWNQTGQGHGVTQWANYPLVPLTWGLFWGLVPLSWTAIAVLIPRKRSEASSLGIWTGIVWQGLTVLESITRWSGLGTATLVLFVNTSYAPTQLRTIATVGVVLGFCITGLEFAQIISVYPLDNALLLAIALLGILWGLRHWLTSRTSLLAELYRPALDFWAYPLAVLTLGSLLLNSPYGLIAPLSHAFQNPLALIVGTLGLIALTAYRSHQFPYTQKTISFNIGLVLCTQLILWHYKPWYLILLAIAFGVTLWQTKRLNSLATALISVGLLLALETRLLLLWLPTLISATGLLINAVTAIALWGSRQIISRRSDPLTTLYAQALDSWGTGICAVSLIGLTLHSWLIYNDIVPASLMGIGAAIAILVGLIYRLGLQPRNRVVYALAWGVELLTLEVLGWTGHSLVPLMIANLLLGIASQVLGDWWQRRLVRSSVSGLSSEPGEPSSPPPERLYLSSFHILPLLYGALGASLRWGLFTRWTGLTTLGLVIIAIGVGRRCQEFKPLLYAAVAGISLSAYELLQYHIIGLAIGDQLLAMATLATVIMYCYRILTPWLIHYLYLSKRELKIIAHLHWILGSLCLLLTLPFVVEMNELMGIGAGIFLTRYALWQGRDPNEPESLEYWVYLGLTEGIGVISYAFYSFHPPTELIQTLFPFIGILAAIAGMILYLLPWANWQWSTRPWQQLAMIIPLAGILPNLQGFYPLNLVAAAGFYGGLAYYLRQFRISYLSLILVDLAMVNTLKHFGLINPFLLGLIVSFSLFYCTWLEPLCGLGLDRQSRHTLRLIGTGIIGVLALRYYAQPGIIPGIIGIIFIFSGLGFRIRAFLYGGTITFIAIALYQLGILITEFPLLKWIVGLAIGLVFIWIAATFESSREKFTTLIRDWLGELEEWE